MNNNNKTFNILLILGLILASLLITACTSTENQVRKQLNSANYCKVESDCVNIGPACPFGCQVYVNKNEEARANRILENYDSKCVYGCLTCEGVECLNGKCQQTC